MEDNVASTCSDSGGGGYGSLVGMQRVGKETNEGKRGGVW